MLRTEILVAGKREEEIWDRVYTNALREIGGKTMPNEIINVMFLDARAELTDLVGDSKEARRLKRWSDDMRDAWYDESDTDLLIQELNEVARPIREGLSVLEGLSDLK
ncbi:MAG: hypothetical protein Q7R43_00405 [Candidatus Daviesbacteria bacterium]|nr:hypothetical protein [Candidatus Daviesbacteria bacterium]